MYSHGLSSLEALSRTNRYGLYSYGMYSYQVPENILIRTHTGTEPENSSGRENILIRTHRTRKLL